MFILWLKLLKSQTISQTLLDYMILFIFLPKYMVTKIEIFVLKLKYEIKKNK